MQTTNIFVKDQVRDAEPRLKLHTVLIPDGLPIVREGLATLINRRSDMRVVAEAANGREAVEKFIAHSPDIALFELRLPLMDGVEAVAFRFIWRSLSPVFGVPVTLREPDTGRGPAYYANRIKGLAKATVEAWSMYVEESAEILFDYAKYR